MNISGEGKHRLVVTTDGPEAHTLGRPDAPVRVRFLDSLVLSDRRRLDVLVQIPLEGVVHRHLVIFPRLSRGAGATSACPGASSPQPASKTTGCPEAPGRPSSQACVLASFSSHFDRNSNAPRRARGCPRGPAANIGKFADRPWAGPDCRCTKGAGDRVACHPRSSRGAPSTSRTMVGRCRPARCTMGLRSA
jgi:hypothetical protein